MTEFTKEDIKKFYGAIGRDTTVIKDYLARGFDFDSDNKWQTSALWCATHQQSPEHCAIFIEFLEKKYAQDPIKLMNKLGEGKESTGGVVNYLLSGRLPEGDKKVEECNALIDTAAHKALLAIPRSINIPPFLKLLLGMDKDGKPLKRGQDEKGDRPR